MIETVVTVLAGVALLVTMTSLIVAMRQVRRNAKNVSHRRQVTLWLTVTTGSWHSGTRLFSKEWNGRPLRDDDRVMLLHGGGDGDEWFHDVEVRRIFIHGDGDETIEFPRHIIDPDPDVEDWFNKQPFRSGHLPWRTADDGDLFAALACSGWVER